MLISEENYLEHYGRLGMKWYQHIYGEADGRAKYQDKWRNAEKEKVEDRAIESHNKLSKKAYNEFLDEKIFKGRETLSRRNSFDQLAKKEVDRIMEMDFEDLMKERNGARWNAVKRFVKSVVFTPWGATQRNLEEDKPVDAADYKTKSRTGQTRNMAWREEEESRIGDLEDYDTHSTRNAQSTVKYEREYVPYKGAILKKNRKKGHFNYKLA